MDWRPGLMVPDPGAVHVLCNHICTNASSRMGHTADSLPFRYLGVDVDFVPVAYIVAVDIFCLVSVPGTPKSAIKACAMNVSVVYDRNCPVCRDIIGLGRLRDRASTLELIDARSGPLDSVQERDLRGCDFDEGFVVVCDGEVFHGADAAHLWGALTGSKSWRYKLFQALVKSDSRSRFWYPWLKRGRSVLLRLLGVPKIADQ